MVHLILLYAMLGDPVYECRERAEATLVHLVDRHPGTYGPRLAELVRTATCPEVRTRGLRVLKVYDRWRVNSYVPRTVPVWPCCDSFPCANAAVPFGIAPDIRCRWTWLPRDCPGGCEGGPWWHRWRRGTECEAKRLILAGWTAEEVDRLLLRMWIIEQAVGDCGPHGTDWRGWNGGYPRP